MRGMKTLTAIFMICTMMTFGATAAMAAGGAQAEPWFVDGMNKEQVILEPGNTTFCNKENITVQNLSKDEMARVRIVRGNGDNYDWDQLDPNQTLSYKRDGISIFAVAPGEHGPTRHKLYDETRVVNATMGKANLKIFCK